jgi:hypothetical protein
MEMNQAVPENEPNTLPLRVATRQDNRATTCDTRIDD